MKNVSYKLTQNKDTLMPVLKIFAEDSGKHSSEITWKMIGFHKEAVNAQYPFRLKPQEAAEFAKSFREAAEFIEKNIFGIWNELAADKDDNQEISTGPGL
jgi:hypothetical protein